MVQTAQEGMMNNATSSEVYGKMQDVFIKMDHGSNVSIHQLNTCITKELFSHYISKDLFVVVGAYQKHLFISDD